MPKTRFVAAVLVTGSWLSRQWLAPAPCPRARCCWGTGPHHGCVGTWEQDHRGQGGELWGRSMARWLGMCWGVITAALPIWNPPALTSRHLLCPCRLAGARSYRCHCHRLPPGHVCACRLGRHHAEEVLGLLNSIKDFSVIQPARLLPSDAPAPHLPGTPWGQMLPRMQQRALQPLRWAAKLRHKVLFALSRSPG